MLKTTVRPKPSACSLLADRLYNIAKAVTMAVGLAALVAAPNWVGGQTLPDYLLHAGDLLEVSVWGEEDLQGEVLIRPDGKFSFPLAGEVQAQNRPVTDIEAELTERLVDYIPEAVVTVSVSGLEGNRIFVIGQVENVGAFVMNPQLTVLQALALAGGTTPFAALDNIKIIRGSGANRQVFDFAYGDVLRGRRIEQDITLEAGDVVVVP